MEERVIYLMVLELKLGLLDLNSRGARKEFWFKIGSHLLSVDHWCMVGDFNMIENFGDRTRGSHSLIGVAELITWDRLCLSFKFQDAWHATSFVRLKIH